ncbi:MAG: DUF4062 domain-containing protein [Pseudomonadales bacterium]
MATDNEKQYVPIFVGSTFIDLKEYREAVRGSLHRLEAIVRGMEYFGSKPGSPIEECIAAVKSCKVYIGVFGMRYGTIPDGQELSMTHLEYEEAQNNKMPSLIYIIDENQPIPPKHVETGDGAINLQKLKENLQKRHLVSFFTTTDDLAAKILHDLPPVLKKLGTKVEGTIETDDVDKSNEVLRRFDVLPKRWRGKEVVIEFVNAADFTSVYDETASALNIDIGGSVGDYLKINSKDLRYVYGEGDLAEQLIDLEKNKTVKARAVTLFGIAVTSDWTDDGPIKKSESVTGLLIKEVISVDPV